MNRRPSRFAAAWIGAGLLLCLDAEAQVRLPTAQVPQLPPIQIPLDPRGAIDGATNALDPERLRDLRRLRIRELVRANRTVLETDPRGAPIVKAEITAYSPSEASLQIARDNGFSIARRTVLGDFGEIVVLTPRAGISTRAALRRLRAADPNGGYDFNHIYIESGQIEDAPPRTGVFAPRTPAKGVKIGLIDTGIEASHPSLQAAIIERYGCDTPQPAAHGTAVASLLIGHATPFDGAAPGAALFAADVYCGSPTGGSIERIATAFAWLRSKQVTVINVSLVGPPNVILERIVTTMVARGHLIVAAVGNDGPASKPLYPAAYKGVIGVTAVDAKRKVLIEAVRGPQVYFAAPGADMGAAGMKSDYVTVRGTSFAAPIVAGLLAQSFSELKHVDRTLAEVAAHAIDLGARGIDKQYGHGLIGEDIRIEPRALTANR